MLSSKLKRPELKLPHLIGTLTDFKIYIYVTAVMDISAESVLAGLNLTGRMDPGMNKHLDRIHEK